LKKNIVRIMDELKLKPSKGIQNPESLLEILEKAEIMRQLLRYLNPQYRTSTVKLSALEDSVSTQTLDKRTRVALSKALFEYMDLNQDGIVQLNELLLVLSGISDSSAADRAHFHFIMMDQDGSGFLCGEELYKLIALEVQAAKVLFDFVLIRDGDSLRKEFDVSQSEFEYVKTQIFSKVFDNPKFISLGVQKLLQFADANHDSNISESEWIKWSLDEKATTHYIEAAKEFVQSLYKNDSAFQNNPNLAKLTSRLVYFTL